MPGDVFICVVIHQEESETDAERSDSVSSCSSSDCPRCQILVLSGCLISINAAMLQGVPDNGGSGEYEVLLSSSHSSLYA